MNNNVKIVLAYIGICLLWGSTWLVIRISLDSLTPMLSAGLRFSLAAVFIFIFMKIKGAKLQTDWLSIKIYIFMGLLSFTIPFYFVYWAEQHIPSGLTSILFGFLPFTVIFFSRLMNPKERIGKYKIGGVIFGFTGIFVIFSDNLQLDITNNVVAMIAVLGSATMQGLVSVTVKKYGSHLSSISIIFIPVAIGGILLTVFGLLIEDLSLVTIDSKAVLSVVYLALFGTLMTFSTFYWLLKNINVVILSLSTFITPIIAVLLGWIVLAEVLSVNDLIGSALVLLGILFANFKGLKNYYYLKRKRKLNEEYS